MCGIHEIIHSKNTTSAQLKNEMNMMLNQTKHRGPDQSEVAIFGNRAAIGMNRLSIVAPNKSSTIQKSDSGNYLVFNGEIVNHTELRKELKNPPSQRSDSTIILPMLEEQGQDAIKKLAGMFAIGLYNLPNNTLQLWRDQLGIKPLYFHQSKEEIIFSSEIKSIAAVMSHEPEIDFAALDHILRYRFQPGRTTVFPDIQRVLPGQTVVFNQSEVSRRQFWNLDTNRTELTPDIGIDQFRKLLVQVIQEHTQADVPGGFFVSGGLDSSLVTAIALREASGSSFRQPISLRFSPKSVVDEGYARILEKSLKTKFEWVDISDEIARQTLVELVPFMDEPLENPIHVGTYLMAKRAHDLGIKTVLTGDGSDEFFLGYERHANWFNNPNPIENYPKLHWTMKPEEAKELYTPEATAAVKPMIDGFGDPVEPFLTMDQALLFERRERLPEYHNMRLDRMTMAHGVEARVPFLDHRIVDYSLQIPVETLFGDSGKGWLQKVAEPWLPSEILNRPKVLFPSLPDQWLSGEGADWAAEILLDPAAQIHKWLKHNIVEKYIKEHKDQTHLRGKQLWAMVALELWLKNQTSWRNPKRN